MYDNNAVHQNIFRNYIGKPNETSKYEKKFFIKFKLVHFLFYFIFASHSL